jgi:hypothetical protein
MYVSFPAGTTKTYTRADLCGAPANGTGYFDPGSLHTAAMTGLQPSTKYYYIYGSDVRSPQTHTCPRLPRITCSFSTSMSPTLVPQMMCEGLQLGSDRHARTVQGMSLWIAAHFPGDSTHANIVKCAKGK